MIILLIIGSLQITSCKSNLKNERIDLNQINTTQREINDKPIEIINKFIEIPIPNRPILELLNENSHFASKQNIEILWNNFLILQKYCNDLEGILNNYKSQIYVLKKELE
jgi:hypothetical protein